MKIPYAAKPVQLVVLLTMAVDTAINPDLITLRHVNCCDLQNKGPIVEDCLNSTSCNILGITETHVSPNDTPAFINEFTTPNYPFDHIPSLHASGGGVGILIKNIFQCKAGRGHSCKNFKTHYCFSTGPWPHSQHCCTLQTTWIPPLLFLDEFMGPLTHLSILKADFVMVGDFSIQYGTDAQYSQKFKTLLVSCNLDLLSTAKCLC